ncbi:MAG: ATP-binding protein [Candidatus Omnitrophica bacterium]|nr:ATP-binding protein [Candidatus Omnitrophota bacterium]
MLRESALRTQRKFLEKNKIKYRRLDSGEVVLPLDQGLKRSESRSFEDELAPGVIAVDQHHQVSSMLRERYRRTGAPVPVLVNFDAHTDMQFYPGIVHEGNWGTKALIEGLAQYFVHIPPRERVFGHAKPRVWTTRRVGWWFRPLIVELKGEALRRFRDEIGGAQAFVTVDTDAYSLQEPVPLLVALNSRGNAGTAGYHTFPKNFQGQSAPLFEFITRHNLKPDDNVCLSRSHDWIDDRLIFDESQGELYFKTLAEHLQKTIGEIKDGEGKPRTAESRSSEFRTRSEMRLGKASGDLDRETAERQAIAWRSIDHSGELLDFSEVASSAGSILLLIANSGHRRAEDAATVKDIAHHLFYAENRAENTKGLFGDFAGPAAVGRWEESLTDIKAQRHRVASLAGTFPLDELEKELFAHILPLLDRAIAILESRIEILQGRISQDLFSFQDVWTLVSERDTKHRSVRSITKIHAGKEDLTGKMTGNPLSMASVLQNLIVNGRKAAEESGVDPEVIVTLRREGGDLVIEVADNGKGLKPEQQVWENGRQKIFELDNSTRLDKGGTGLGTTEAWYVVKDMGGTIEAANRPEGGAQFTLRLPLLTSEVANNQVRSEMRGQGVAPEFVKSSELIPNVTYRNRYETVISWLIGNRYLPLGTLNGAAVVDIGSSDGTATAGLAAALREKGVSVKVYAVDREVRASAEGLIPLVDDHQLNGEGRKIREPVKLMTMFNVTRHYRSPAIRSMVEAMAQKLDEGGLLLIGNGGPGDYMRAMKFIVFQKTGGKLVPREIVAKEFQSSYGSLSRGIDLFSWADYLASSEAGKLGPFFRRAERALDATWYELRSIDPDLSEGERKKAAMQVELAGLEKYGIKFQKLDDGSVILPLEQWAVTREYFLDRLGQILGRVRELFSQGRNDAQPQSPRFVTAEVVKRSARSEMRTGTPSDSVSLYTLTESDFENRTELLSDYSALKYRYPEAIKRFAGELAAKFKETYPGIEQNDEWVLVSVQIRPYSPPIYPVVKELAALLGVPHAVYRTREWRSAIPGYSAHPTAQMRAEEVADEVLVPYEGDEGGLSGKNVIFVDDARNTGVMSDHYMKQLKDLGPKELFSAFILDLNLKNPANEARINEWLLEQKNYAAVAVKTFASEDGQAQRGLLSRLLRQPRNIFELILGLVQPQTSKDLLRLVDEAGKGSSYPDHVRSLQQRVRGTALDQRSEIRQVGSPLETVSPRTAPNGSAVLGTGMETVGKDLAPGEVILDRDQKMLDRLREHVRRTGKIVPVLLDFDASTDVSFYANLLPYGHWGMTALREGLVDVFAHIKPGDRLIGAAKPRLWMLREVWWWPRPVIMEVKGRELEQWTARISWSEAFLTTEHLSKAEDITKRTRLDGRMREEAEGSVAGAKGRPVEAFRMKPRTAYYPGGLDLSIFEFFPELETAHYFNQWPFRVLFDKSRLMDALSGELKEFPGLPVFEKMMLLYLFYAKTRPYFFTEFQQKIFHPKALRDPQIGVEPFMLADLKREGATEIHVRELRDRVHEIRFKDENGKERRIVYHEERIDPKAIMKTIGPTDEKADLLYVKAFEDLYDVAFHKSLLSGLNSGALLASDFEEAKILRQVPGLIGPRPLGMLRFADRARAGYSKGLTVFSMKLPEARVRSEMRKESVDEEFRKEVIEPIAKKLAEKKGKGPQILLFEGDDKASIGQVLKDEGVGEYAAANIALMKADDYLGENGEILNSKLFAFTEDLNKVLKQKVNQLVVISGNQAFTFWAGANIKVSIVKTLISDSPSMDKNAQYYDLTVPPLTRSEMRNVAVSEEFRKKVIEPITKVLTEKKKVGQPYQILTLTGAAGNGKTAVGQLLQDEGVGGYDRAEIAFLETDLFLRREGLGAPKLNRVSFNKELNALLEKGNRLIIVAGVFAPDLLEGTDHVSESVQVFMNANFEIQRLRTLLRDRNILNYLDTYPMFITGRSYDLVLKDLPPFTLPLAPAAVDPFSFVSPGIYGPKKEEQSYKVSRKDADRIIELLYREGKKAGLRGVPDPFSSEYSEIEQFTWGVWRTMIELSDKGADSAIMTLRIFEKGLEVVFDGEQDRRAGDGWGSRLSVELRDTTPERLFADKTHWVARTLGQKPSPSPVPTGHLVAALGFPREFSSRVFSRESFDGLFTPEVRSEMRATSTKMDKASRLTPDMGKPLDIARLAVALKATGFEQQVIDQDLKILGATQTSDFRGDKGLRIESDDVAVRVAGIVRGILDLTGSEAAERLHMLAVAIGANATRTLVSVFEESFPGHVLPVGDQPSLVVDVLEAPPTEEKWQAIEAVLQLNKHQHYGIVFLAERDRELVEKVRALGPEIRERIHVERLDPKTENRTQLTKERIERIYHQVRSGDRSREWTESAKRARSRETFVVTGAEAVCRKLTNFEGWQAAVVQRVHERGLEVPETIVAVAFSQELLQGEKLSEKTSRAIQRIERHYRFNAVTLTALLSQVLREIESLQSIRSAA